jgi:hypothetical protein
MGARLAPACRRTRRAPDGTLEGKRVSAVFYVGTYDRKRVCRDTAAQPYGGVGGVTYSSVGPSASVAGAVGQFAERPWNCGWVTLKDLGIEKEAVDDRTSACSLGKRAIAENRRLLRKRLKRCARQRGAAKRAACRSAARERFPG